MLAAEISQAVCAFLARSRRAYAHGHRGIFYANCEPSDETRGPESIEPRARRVDRRRRLMLLGDWNKRYGDEKRSWIEGGLTQGLGFSLMEHLMLEDGRVMTLSFGDYKIPTIQDVPPLTLSVVKAREGPGPFGAKSVAECGIGVAAPAITNAIYQATGGRITELPVAAEKVLDGLRAKKTYQGPGPKRSMAS
jgi:hypothetical protein